MVLGPARAFVPVLAGDDVELAIAVDVGCGAGFVRAQIEGVLFERDFGGADDAPRGNGRGQQ